MSMSALRATCLGPSMIVEDEEDDDDASPLLLSLLLLLLLSSSSSSSAPSSKNARSGILSLACELGTESLGGLGDSRSILARISSGILASLRVLVLTITHVDVARPRGLPDRASRSSQLRVAATRPSSWNHVSTWTMSPQRGYSSIWIWMRVAAKIRLRATMIGSVAYPASVRPQSATAWFPATSWRRLAMVVMEEPRSGPTS